MRGPVNFRRINPQSCETCKLNVLDESIGADGMRVCMRSDEPEWGEPEDMGMYVCDGYESIKGNKAE